MKLTDRQGVLLIVVDESTKWLQSDERPGRGEHTYFVPRVDGTWSEFFKSRIIYGGPGDASVLRALERRGLVKPHPTYGRTSYWFAITEDGILQAEKEREKRR